MPNYDWVTDDLFDQQLAEIVHQQRNSLLSVPGVYEVLSEQFDGDVSDEEITHMSSDEILAIPGMYEVLSEEFNNYVLEDLEADRDTEPVDDSEDDPNYQPMGGGGWRKLKPGHPDYVPPRGAAMKAKARRHYALAPIDDLQDPDDLAQHYDLLIVMSPDEGRTWKVVDGENTEHAAQEALDDYTDLFADRTDLVTIYDQRNAPRQAAANYVVEPEAIPIANPEDATSGYHNRPRRLFYMTFGAYGEDKCYVWADHAEDAIEEGARWLKETDASELISEDELYGDTALWDEAREELGPGADEMTLYEKVTADLYHTQSDYLFDWTIDDVDDDDDIAETLARSTADMTE